MEGESSDLSSSVDPSNQKQSKRSKRIKRSSALRKILKNIRKQKKQSNQIEKIFQSSKSQERRSSLVEDPFILRVPESSNEDTKKASQKSKNDLKIVKFNVKDGKSPKLSDKLKKVDEEASGVTTRSALQIKKQSISKLSNSKNSLKVSKKSLKKEKTLSMVS